MLKVILQKILNSLARIIIRKYRPKIVGITGSVGKTSTREAIFSVLNVKFSVRASKKNYNTEVGLSLTVLGIDHGGHNIFVWFFYLVKVFFQLVLRRGQYPKILVLEYGIDHPGDMERLLSIARPSVAVVTAFGDVPVHVEFFKDSEEVRQEKAKLVRALPEDGIAILNHDDYAVYDMRDSTTAKVVTFGFEEGSEITIFGYAPRSKRDQIWGEIPDGISFKLKCGGKEIDAVVHGGFGKPQAYAAAAAAAVGISLGVSLEEIVEAIKSYYVPPPGRMRLIQGNKKSLILDDTYNAAPEAMHSALGTLEELPARRKIAVLGDMLEIGKYTEQVHRSVGDHVARFVDILITVGPRAKFILDEARFRGGKLGVRTLDRGRISSFDNPLDAGRKLDQILQPGDLVLIKGSQSMRMEKVVEEVMAHPEFAGKLLVRQEKFWEN